MSIRFSCLCGKRLKAGESHAGRRIMCPKCKRPVMIPAAEPTAETEPVRDYFAEDPFAERPGSSSSEGSAPRSSATRPGRRPGRNGPKRTQPAAPQQSTSDLVLEQAAAGSAVEIGLRNQPRWHRLLPGRRANPAMVAPSLEFEYSLGAVPLVGGICLAMTLTGGLSARLLPDAVQGQTFGTFSIIAAAMTIFLAATTYATSLIGQSLGNAIGGNILEIDHDPVLALRHMLVWMSSLLAGPVVPLFATIWFWVTIGHGTPLDVLILFELALATALWFILNLLSIVRENSIRSLRPAKTMKLARDLPGPLLQAGLIAVILTAAAFAVTSAAFERIHNDDGLGFLLFALVCVGLVVGNTVNARLLGRAVFRVEQQQTQTPIDEQAESAAERRHESLKESSQRATGAGG